VALAFEIRFRQRERAGAAEVNEFHPTLHGIVLAAGASSRMGTAKALLRHEGQTFLQRLLSAFAGVCDSVAVVTAPQAAENAAAAEQSGVEVVINPAPDRGMLSSLQCALASRDADGYLFTPVDYPAIARSTIAAIADAFRRSRPAVVVPVFEGRHGHPVCASRAVAREMLALPYSASARVVIHAHANQTHYVKVDDPGIVRDVDTPEEYAELTRGERP